MHRSRVALSIALLALLLSPVLGCGSDDTSDTENGGEGWNLGNNDDPNGNNAENNGGAPNNQPSPNQGPGNTNNDTPNNPPNQGPNNGVPSNSEPNNGVPSNQNDPNNGVPNQPDPFPDEDVTKDDLIGHTLYGVWRVVDTPAIAGLYFSVEFVDDSTVIFNTDQTLQGDWDILSEGDVHVYNLNGPVDQYLLTPDYDDGFALELQVPADVVAPYRLRFELPTSDLAIESLEGRWQSTETIVGDDGEARYMAIRVDGQGYIEYGSLSDAGTFFGILQGPGHIHTFNDSGRHFWVMDTDSGPEPVPFAGEIDDVPAGFALYSFAEDFTEPANPAVISVEFEEVDQFSID